MSGPDIESRRIEPIFQLQTPLLFAHRGGALEVPECTPLAFAHAISEAGADVLELDVHLTKDGEIVVWHGPELDNVRIRGESDRPAERPGDRRMIYHYNWPELEKKAWVADPDIFKEAPETMDLSQVRQTDDRCLMRLGDFLRRFPTMPLNIDIKKSFTRKIHTASGQVRSLEENVRAFYDILAEDAKTREAQIVVASFSRRIIRLFRSMNRKNFPTALSEMEIILGRQYGDMTNRAFETAYIRFLSGRRTIERVRRAGGSTFVFLTGLLFFPALDREPPAENLIFEILDRGVDGIMTDRPTPVRAIIDKWIRQRSGI